MGIVLHTNIRWPSKAQILAKVSLFAMLPSNKIFFEERRGEKVELEDKEWLFYLAFLTNFITDLSDMNLELN